MSRPKKDPFDALSGDFKDAVAAMSPDEIKVRVAKIALDHATLMKAKEDDQDLQEKMAVASEANAVYREGTKAQKLMIRYCQRVLEDKGAA